MANATQRAGAIADFWIDVGGTFTDCIYRDAAGHLKNIKVLSSGSYLGKVISTNSASAVVSGISSFPRDFFRGYRIVFRSANQHQNQNQKSQATTIVTSNADQVSFSDPINLEEPVQTYEIFSGETAPLVAIRQALGINLDTSVGKIRLKLGTTLGTNALLERQGARTLFVTTAGLEDLVTIGSQARPALFKLNIIKPEPLYERVIGVNERTGHDGSVVLALSSEEKQRLGKRLSEERQAGLTSVAIALLNAYRNGDHEQAVAKLAKDAGFAQVSVSHSLAPAQKLLSRAETTIVDAYLSPVISDYLASLRASLPEAEIFVMTSAGGLVSANDFVGKDSILSGPAGGAIATETIGKANGESRLIGFDMGGTSTDVCRIDGQIERRYEMELQSPEGVSHARIVAPMVSVETIAAGGGSICWYDGVRLRVGPQSARSNPGPACYGRGGPLTITDCNLILGRILSDCFPFPLDVEATRQGLRALAREIISAGGPAYDEFTLADGLRQIAISNMGRPIKTISLGKGRDVRDYTLLSFGGAAGQHCCDLADHLGIRKIVHHPMASLLSAYGIGQATVRAFAVKEIRLLVTETTLLNETFKELENEVAAKLAHYASLPCFTRTIDARYVGQDIPLTLPVPNETHEDTERLFVETHRRVYGFVYDARPVEITAVRVEGATKTAIDDTSTEEALLQLQVKAHSLHVGGSRREVPVITLAQLATGASIEGPALLLSTTTTIALESGWTATKRDNGTTWLTARTLQHIGIRGADLDPIGLTLFNNQLTSIAEQMGTMLQRTALSVNVKERLDFSCALFTCEGDLVVNAPHIPVHLGAMGETVRAITQTFPDMRAGDVFVTNDPGRGGSHLPDVTVIAPFFGKDQTGPLFFTGSRAHHAEIGGITPGSMPPNSRNLEEEGCLIEPMRLTREGKVDFEELKRTLTEHRYPTRALRDNLADIHAQMAACELGKTLLQDMIDTVGESYVETAMDAVRQAAAGAVRRALQKHGAGKYAFADSMDDGTKIAVRITIDQEGSAIFDFSGTDPVHPGNLNASPGIVRAAVLYCLRCLIDEDIPLNDGVLIPIKIILPAGSVLSPDFSQPKPGQRPAVVGGNVETSQRVCDVILGALQIVAASQGTMNNLIFGRDPQGDMPGLGYYETIAGGAGAGPAFDGASSVQTHMTNTRITDPEVIEDRLPVRLRTFRIRQGSGGHGAHRGGDGLIREIEFLEPMTVSLLTSRRSSSPYGLNGGEQGASGKNELVKGAVSHVLEGNTRVDVEAGDVIRIATPGGGGYGEQH